MKIFKEKNELVFAFILLLLIVILKYPVLNLPYSWDAMNYVIPAAQHVYENGFNIFLWEYGNGHPPFYFLLLGFLFKIFGNTPFVANSTILVFSFLAVYFTYLIGKNLFNRKVGIIAAILMFFYPTFFSYSGLSYLEIPLVALTVMSIYFFIKNNDWLYVLFSCLLVLTKETGIFVIVALLIYEVIKDKKINIKKNLIHAIPLILFSLWLLSNKLHYGSFLYPINATLFSFNITILFNIFIVLKSLFFDNYKWILTSFIILSCSSSIFKNKRKIIYAIIPYLLLFFLLFNSPYLFNGLDKHFPNIINYLTILKNFSWLFSILFFILILSFKQLINYFNIQKAYPLYYSFLFMFILYVIFSQFPVRYGLPSYPLIFIIFSLSLVRIFKKYSYLAFLIILALFISVENGKSNNVGFVLENNMEYVDMIKTHEMATNYLQNNFPNSVILASYPQSLELKYPYLGYVNKPMSIVSIPPYPGLTTKNSTIYNNPYGYNKTIDLNSIDLIYYSEQEFKTKYSRELNKILKKNLIKRFEINGKVVEIYSIDKNYNYPNYTLPLD